MRDAFDPVYQHYWECKRLRAERLPRFAIKQWWDDPGLCEIERVYFEAIRASSSLLDIGAGDLRIRCKFLAAGFAGEYHSQDVGTEFPHDYRDLDDVRRTYQAILCLDVIEHLPLGEGLLMVNKMIDLLDSGGVLIIQTPNARCIANPLSWDMTHLHSYNLPDLWSYLTVLGLDTEGYRVGFERPDLSVLGRLRAFAVKLHTTKLVGMDYATNIALVARKAVAG